MKAPGGHQLDSVVSELYRCCLQQRTVLSVGGEQPRALGTAWSSHRTLWPTTQSNVTHSRSRKLRLAARDDRMPLFLPHWLAISSRSPSYMYVFWETPTVLGSHTTPQMALNFNCLFLYSPLSPSSLHEHLFQSLSLKLCCICSEVELPAPTVFYFGSLTTHQTVLHSIRALPRFLIPKYCPSPQFLHIAANDCFSALFGFVQCRAGR